VAQSSEVIGVNGDGHSLSAVKASDGTQILAYINTRNGQLKVSESSGSGWTSKVLGTGYDATGSVAAATAGGEVSILAVNAAAGTLVEYVRGKAWSPAVTVSSNVRGTLAVATRGEELLVSVGERSKKDLYLARKRASWKVTLLDGAFEDVGGESSIAVSPKGQVSVAYSDATRHRTKVALSADSLNWTIDTLSYPEAFTGRNPVVRWSPDETVHVLAGDTPEGSSIDGQGIMHAQKRPFDTWAVEKIGFPLYGAISGEFLSIAKTVSLVAAVRNQGRSGLWVAERAPNGIWGGASLLSSSTEKYSNLVTLDAGGKTPLIFLRAVSADGARIRLFAADKANNGSSGGSGGGNGTASKLCIPVSKRSGTIELKNSLKHAQSVDLRFVSKSKARRSKPISLRGGGKKSVKLDKLVLGSGLLCVLSNDAEGGVSGRYFGSGRRRQSTKLQSGRAGVQSIVFQKASGKGKARTTNSLLLINPAGGTVTGNITITDAEGFVKKIIRASLRPESSSTISSRSLNLGSRGQIEWRPDDTAAQVVMALEQRSRKGRSTTSTQIEGKTPSAARQVLRLSKQGKILIANQSELPLVVQVEPSGTAPQVRTIPPKAIVAIAAKKGSVQSISQNAQQFALLKLAAK